MTIKCWSDASPERFNLDKTGTKKKELAMLGLTKTVNADITAVSLAEDEKTVIGIRLRAPGLYGGTDLGWRGSDKGVIVEFGFNANGCIPTVYEPKIVGKDRQNRDFKEEHWLTPTKKWGFVNQILILLAKTPMKENGIKVDDKFLADRLHRDWQYRVKIAEKKP